MSAQAPPIPRSKAEIAALRDKRTKGLHHLVNLLVQALASYDPQGIVAAISTFVRYFTRLLEILDLFTKPKDNSTNPKGASVS
jgi:hypothetical protein